MPRLGTRKLHYLLKDVFSQDRIRIGRDKLFDLLREDDLLVKKQRRYTKTTNSRHWMRKYPNLIRIMELTRPEQVWVADITYIPVENGFNYLHLVTDAYSKQIMGYELSEDLAASSSVKALRMALKNRKYTNELIHHSDRGLQYCSAAYTRLLSDNNITISMTEQSDPYENAIAERVNGILKDEFGLSEVFENTAQAIKQITQSINTYNTLRPHQSCSMLTPNLMHAQSLVKLKSWKNKKLECYTATPV